MEINPFKYLTFKRTKNILKILISFVISKIIRKPIVWGMPISYSIEPTNFCNLRCPECPSGTGELTRPLGMLSVESFKEIIDQIYETGFYVQLFFQGEPYLNKHLGEMVEYAQKKNVYISISTNGNLFNEKNIDIFIRNAPDKIIFSLDGLDEETYQNYRVGGSFKKADEALQLITNTKQKLKLDKPFVELQFIVMKQNENQIDDVVAYSKKRNVDRLVFKTMQVNSYESAIKFLPTDKKYSRYVLEDGNIKVKGEQKNHCFALWRTAVITWDGMMVPCCFDKDGNYVLGSLQKNNVKNIWTSERYQNFRASVLENRKQNSMCNNCTEGLKVNILEIEN